MMNRRTTLGAISASQANVMAGRPSVGASRKSLLPQKAASNAQSASNNGNNGNGANNGSSRLSLAPGRGGAPDQQQARRSVGDRASLSRRASMHDKAVTSIMKDPRPLTDKSFQSACIKNLITFLMSNGYPHPLSQKLLTAPSSKDFARIFQHIYLLIDPKHNFNNVQMEEEIPMLFKKLKYPFQMSKSLLLTVGAMHVWPTVLGALTWLVELVSYYLTVDVSSRGGAGGFEQDCNDNEVFFDYIKRQYALYLSNKDDELGQLSEEMSNTFETRVGDLKSEIDRLQHQQAELMKEIDDFKNNQSPLEEAEHRMKLLSSDREKFVKMCAQLQEHKAHQERKLNDVQRQDETIEKELATHISERARLQDILDHQEMSAADVERINMEKAKLEESLRSVGAQREAAERDIWEREMSASKKLEQLEASVNAYHKLAERLQLLPSTATNAHGVNYELHLNPHAPRPEQVLSVDLKGVVKPSLIRLKESIHTRIAEAQEQLLVIQERHDQISDASTERADEVGLLENKVKKMEAQYAEEKETLSAEYKERAEDIAALEREVQRLRQAAEKGLHDSVRSLQKLRTEYEELQGKCRHERDEANVLVVKTLELVTAHKTYVHDRLSHLRSFASKMKKEVESTVV
eukprot:Opistho-2@7459